MNAYTTFKQLCDWGACRPSYRKLAKALGGIKTYGRTKPIPVTKILDICGLGDCFWVLCRADLSLEQDRDIRLLACDFFECALPIFEARYPCDKRPRIAVETVRRFIDGEVSPEELTAAIRAAGWAAAWAVEADGTVRTARAADWAVWASEEVADEKQQVKMLREVLERWEAKK